MICKQRLLNAWEFQPKGAVLKHFTKYLILNFPEFTKNRFNFFQDNLKSIAEKKKLKMCRFFWFRHTKTEKKIIDELID